MPSSTDLKDRVILVTGASRGVGYQVALEAGRRGAHVIALARTVGGLEDLDDAIGKVGGSATLVPLDLRDFDALDRLGAAIFERWKRLDGVVGNAGVAGTIGPVGHTDPKDFEKALAINVTANFRLIRSVDALLRQSDAGRALFLTTGAATETIPYFATITATKMALEGLVRSYAAEIANTKVRANAFNPGPLRTAFRAATHPGSNPDSLTMPEVVAPQIVDMLLPGYTQNGVLVNYAGATRPL